MTQTQPDLRELLARAAEIEKRYKATTPGEWSCDATKNEGSYGSGEDCHEGYDSYELIVEVGGKAETLADSINASYQMIDEEYDGDENGSYHSAWDEIARKNFEFIAHAHQDIPWLLDQVKALADLSSAQEAPVDEKGLIELLAREMKAAGFGSAWVDRIILLEEPQTAEDKYYLWMLKAFKATLSTLSTGRDGVLEDAAKVAFDALEDQQRPEWMRAANGVAAAIRALKSAPLSAPADSVTDALDAAMLEHSQVCLIIDSLPKSASPFDFVRAGFQAALSAKAK